VNPGHPKSPAADELRPAAEFRLALRRFHAATDRVVRSFGLTPRQYLLLLTVESWEPNDATIGSLAAALGLAPSTMTELLDRAERAGLLKRVQAGHDGRLFYVRTTPEGRRRLERAFLALAEERRQVAGIAQALLEDVEEPS
jgi:DNA-binding MarR family transcriptional regulator